MLAINLTKIEKTVENSLALNNFDSSGLNILYKNIRA